jgi:hypothetical protein
MCRRLAVGRWNPASDAQMSATCLAFESRASISNGHLNVGVHRFKVSDASGGTHRTRPSAPDATQRALQIAQASDASDASSSDAP